MLRKLIVMIALLSQAPSVVAGERFAGSATLAEAVTPGSTDGGARFSVQAELTNQPARTSQKNDSESTGLQQATAHPRALEMTNGRFGLTARFTNALAGAACGLAPPDTIFSNGFED